MARKPKTHYEILGVSRNASTEEIRKAFRKKAKLHHPDAGDGADPEAFRAAQEAYEALKDSESRAAYDAELRLRERGFGGQGAGGAGGGWPGAGSAAGRGPGGNDPRRGFGAGPGATRGPSGGSGTWGPGGDDIFGAEDELFGRILNELFGGGGSGSARGGFGGSRAGAGGGLGGFGDIFSGGEEDPVYGDPRFEEPGGFGAGGGFGGAGSPGGGAFSDVEDERFGPRRRGRGAADPLNVVVHLSPDECYTGGTATVQVGGGRSLLAEIPPGVHDGDVIRSQFMDRGAPRELRLRIRVD